MTNIKKLALAAAFAAFAATGAQAATEGTLFLLQPTTEGDPAVSSETYLIDSLGGDITGAMTTRVAKDTFVDDYLLEINDAQDVSFFAQANTVKVGHAFLQGVSFTGFVLTDATGANTFYGADSFVSPGFVSGDWILGTGVYDLEITGKISVNGGGYTGEVDTSPAPEPTGWAMMMAGIATMGMLARRRKSQA